MLHLKKIFKQNDYLNKTYFMRTKLNEMYNNKFKIFYKYMPFKTKIFK
jgi:hypothetical protein